MLFNNLNHSILRNVRPRFVVQELKRHFQQKTTDSYTPKHCDKRL
jgi:hypothetical protein